MSTKLEMLFLSEEDLIEAGVLDAKKCVEVMEEMFKTLGQGDYLLGGPSENDHGIRIWFPKEKRFENMPTAGPDRRFMALVSYLGGKHNITGEKWYGSNAENHKKDLPRSILTITLNDVETGQPLAYMTANLISATRTGAIPGVATKYLATNHADTLAIIGAGVISWSTVLAILASNKKIKHVRVFDIQKNRAEDFCERLEKEHNVETEATETMKDALKDADLVNIATSGTVQPEVNNDDLKNGAVLMISGGATLTDEFLLKNKIVFDNWKMHKSTAEDWIEWEERQSNIQDIQEGLYYGIGGQVYRLMKQKKLSESDIIDLGDIVIGNKKARASDKEIIVFFAGGMSTEDIAWAHTLYKEAKQKGLGQTLKLWDKSHLS